ncbi:MAG: response regulator [Candidatus Dadabacteria bacterium]|nr:response regulator [Candidatus Dadabacteria bacterium]MYA47771.1 response regulator [Candidatus Dadabacteria bacterium]MYG83616.1 response regulator [Candidatus Dadabacteria bacterium]MYK48795.1 response regulator [Candidatus Dadabacteria bacterium]
MGISWKTICVVADDMFFSSKIENTAKGLDIGVIKVKNCEELLDKIEGETIDLVIIDLASRKIDAEKVFTELKNSKKHGKVFCIGYLPHVEKELADKFREKGVDLVIPRSKFSREMSAIIKENLKQQ